MFTTRLRRDVVLALSTVLLASASTKLQAADTRIQRLNPQTLPQFPYSTQIVIADHGKRVAHIAGQTAMNVQLSVDKVTLAEQIPESLKNFDLALQAVGATRADLMKLNVFYVDHDGTGAPLITKALESYFKIAKPPAVTFVGVPSLVSPAMLIEIDGLVALEK
jgi:enamine deaminase RidA (YjgF/YER057c/UK114 family)